MKSMKRALDCDFQHQGPIKRLRCDSHQHIPINLPSTSTSAKVFKTVKHNPVARICIETFSGNNPNFINSPCVFSGSLVSKITPDEMKQNIRAEIKRLHKRKELHSSSTTAIEYMQDSNFGDVEIECDYPRHSRSPEKVLFTFKQVQLNCERILKEWEDEIHEKYENVLKTRLAEQYDAFVKFNHDQIQRRYESVPSYLS